MTKIYRFLGNRGRTTIPYPLRSAVGLKRNDLVSFERHGDTIVVRKEKICDGCSDSYEQMTNPSVAAEETQKKQIIQTSMTLKTLELEF